MTIPFNLLLCLLLGLTFAACARTQLQGGAQPWRRELLLVLSFALLTVLPLSSYYYWLYPDWSWMYLVAPARLPAGIGLAVVVVTTGMAPVGFILGWTLLRALRERGPQAVFGLCGALSMALVLVLVLGHRRLSVLGGYDDFQSWPLQGPLLRPLFRTKLGLSFLGTVPVLLMGSFLVGYYLWGYGRWLRQQAQSHPHPESRDGVVPRQTPSR